MKETECIEAYNGYPENFDKNLLTKFLQFQKPFLDTKKLIVEAEKGKDIHKDVSVFSDIHLLFVNCDYIWMCLKLSIDINK